MAEEMCQASEFATNSARPGQHIAIGSLRWTGATDCLPKIACNLSDHVTKPGETILLSLLSSIQNPQTCLGFKHPPRERKSDRPMWKNTTPVDRFDATQFLQQRPSGPIGALLCLIQPWCHPPTHPGPTYHPHIPSSP
jgi:hypothetical protein